MIPDHLKDIWRDLSRTEQRQVIEDFGHVVQLICRSPDDASKAVTVFNHRLRPLGLTMMLGGAPTCTADEGT